jgi:hypothetical protein
MLKNLLNILVKMVDRGCLPSERIFLLLCGCRFFFSLRLRVIASLRCIPFLKQYARFLFVPLCLWVEFLFG